MDGGVEREGKGREVMDKRWGGGGMQHVVDKDCTDLCAAPDRV